MKRFIVKAACFILLTVVLLNRVNYVLMPKWIERPYYNALSQPYGFYHLKKNTTDVLLVGSSHCFYNYSPQVIYDNYSIRSYSLASPGQNLIGSYYWIKEALKYQKPQAIVLDTLYFFTDLSDPYNEGAHRKAINRMRFSPLKVQAILDICKATPALKETSFLLPYTKFHSRWKELKMEDFSGPELSRHSELKGILPIPWIQHDDSYSPFETDSVIVPATIPEIDEKYIRKIASLCENNGIQLVFVKAPAKSWSADQSAGVKLIAEELGIPFYDMNLASLYSELDDYDYAEDGSDSLGHANVRGMIKLSEYLGQVLSNDFHIIGKIDSQWESTSDYWEGIVKDFYLTQTESFKDYCNSLAKDDHYTLFLASCGQIAGEEYDEINACLETLGISFRNSEGNAFVAVVDDGDIIYEVNKKNRAELNTSLDNGLIRIEMSSSNTKSEKTARIRMVDIYGGNEYARNGTGFNVVVYDKYNMYVIDRFFVSDSSIIR